MKPSRVLSKLRRNEVVSMATLWAVPHWKIVEMMGLTGFDCLWLEYEHSSFSREQMSQMILAARATDLDVMVRVPRGPYNEVIKPLEAGATGLLWPHCTGAADAHEFVRMARFAPLGWRGMGGSVDNRYGSVPLADYVAHANTEIFLAVMIERKEAVEEADAIAAIDGLDILYIGPSDLSQSYGVLGQTDHPLIVAAAERVASACGKHGKHWGISSRPHARWHALGSRLFVVGDEMNTLMHGFRRMLEEFEAEVGP